MTFRAARWSRDGVHLRGGRTFGTSALVGTAATTHTYAAAGTYTVTLVIFDAKGDQVRIVKSVVVS